MVAVVQYASVASYLRYRTLYHTDERQADVDSKKKREEDGKEVHNGETEATGKDQWRR